MMMKCFNRDIFFPKCHEVEPEFVGGEHGSNSAGTLLLQRADYLPDSGEPFLSPAQHRTLAKLIHEDDPATKGKMIAHNLVQVINIAHRYANRGLGLPDMVRQGNEGLIQALKRYKPLSVSCFSSFVTLCVCQQINLAILNQKRPPKAIPRIPVGSLQPLRKQN
jgi:DNA-directed RNA polymerase sigma subunit (sigma70/sigma32)